MFIFLLHPTSHDQVLFTKTTSNPSASTNLFLGLYDGEVLNAVLHQHCVELGNIPLPLEGEACCHLSKHQASRSNLWDRVYLQNDREIILNYHIKCSKTTEVEHSVGNFCYLGNLQNNLTPQVFRRSHDGCFGRVV